MKDITMNGKEQQRAMILTGVIEGRLTAGEAAELMSLSQRQERRLRHAFLRDGPAALGHGNRGGEAMARGRSSGRRILRAAGRRSPQRRRAARHRSRRERMPQAGMLLQVDGSRHQWLGPAGPWLTPVGAIGNASGG